MSSYFGDWEWDIGKSVRWTQYLVNDIFMVDIMVGDTTRNWVVAWDQSFPEVQHTFVKDFTFFDDPPRWRRESFEKARATYGYALDDWVVFTDCTEGLTLDDRTPAPSANPFEWYLQEEIRLTGGQSILALPVYAYLHIDPPVTHAARIIDPVLEASLLSQLAALQAQPGDTTQAQKAIFDMQVVNRSYDIYGIPQYLFAGWSPRIFQVSDLANPLFDWSCIDTIYPVAKPEFSPAVYTSLVSYAYARWAEEDTQRDPDTLLPLTLNEDVGWVMRRAMDSVRPIPGLQDTNWSSADPAGSDGYLAVAQNDDAPFVALRTPIYHGTFRDNIRDGLFYYDTVLGPVPWNLVREQAAVDPVEWAEQVPIIQ
jgi:hypothetical protein